MLPGLNLDLCGNSPEGWKTITRCRSGDLVGYRLDLLPIELLLSVMKAGHVLLQITYKQGNKWLNHRIFSETGNSL